MAFLDFFRGSSDERIARHFIRSLRGAGEQRRLEYDAAERVVVVYAERGERAQLCYVGNLAREIRAADPAAHESIYLRYALGAIEADGAGSSEYELVRPRLRLLLKDSVYPDHMTLINHNDFPDSKESAFVFEHLPGDVIACCIEEGDQGLRFVKQDDLAKWGIDASTALSDAKANVCALPYTISDPMPARYILNDDSFIASRFVNPRMFDGLPLVGEWVAVIPDRDTFFVVDSANSEAVEGLARLAMQQLKAGERIISGLPFVLRAGHWEIYEAPEPARSLFSNVALQFRAKYWADYKGDLEKDLRNRGLDIFVASLMVREEAGVDAHYCMAVWTKGVNTILPVVDRVFFNDDVRKAIRVAMWPEVVRIMGAEMHREPELPERYRVTAFPNAEQFAAMGARSV